MEILLNYLVYKILLILLKLKNIYISKLIKLVNNLKYLILIKNNH